MEKNNDAPSPKDSSVNQAKDTKNDRKQRNCREEPGIHLNNLFSKENRQKYNFSFWYFIIMLVILIVINNLLMSPQERPEAIEYNVFKEKIVSGEIKRVEITDREYIGYTMTRAEIQAMQEEAPAVLTPASPSYSTYRVDDPSFIPLLDEKKVEYYAVPPREPGFFMTMLSWFFPIIVLVLVWRYLFSRMNKSGQGVMAFGQNKAKIVAEGDTGVRFADVAGADECKYELEEVVDFLQRPERYTEIGGKIPKGVLLVGAPGTGKTLLARAVAGEAGVPFFRMSGADFVEMFVGVGAARVRDLFRQAREKSPCIIFIDEMDAIGKSRQVGGFGGNDEREQTLNQLLVEMDGFDARAGVIILGATNRPEILDPALLRPGRFDRQVLIPKPDLDGREAILKIHARGIKMSPKVDLRMVAQGTAGLAGADLANIVNEAALLAVRSNRKLVNQDDLSEAIEKSFAGLQRKNRVMNQKEREKIAYHEAGHALAAYFTKGSDPVTKVSIIPRGIGALGYTLQLPTEDRFIMSESEILSIIDVLLGGRAAEEIIFNEVSTGASNDISRASDLVRRMITEFGMSEKFRNITLPSGSGQESMLGTFMRGSREYSEFTQQYIDDETAKIVNKEYKKILDVLTKYRSLLKHIAQLLLEKEVIDGSEFARIIKEHNAQKDTLKDDTVTAQ